MKSFVLPAEGTKFKAEWPCKVGVPVDGGKIEEQEIKPVFQLLDQSEIDVFFEQGLKALGEKDGVSTEDWRRFGPTAVFMAERESCLNFLEQAIVDIPELKKLDSDGKPAKQAFSRDELGVLIDMQFMRTALLLGYSRFMTGAREKNSETSSD